MNERYELDGEKTVKNRAQLIKTVTLASVVVCVHVLAIGGFFAIQGCGTVQGEPQAVEPAPAPVMPPKASVSQQQHKTPPRRAIRPPVPVEPAPAMMDSRHAESYVIQKGDSLSKIAQRYDLSSRELCELNGIKNPNSIRVGQKLILPPYAKKQPMSAAAPSVARKTSPKPQSKAVVSSGSSTIPSAGGEYVVQSGDMLSKIAVKSGTTVKALREANKMTGDKIVVGQKLIIPKGSAPASASASAPALADKPAAAASSTVKTADTATKPVETAVAAPVVKETIMAEDVKAAAPSAASSATASPSATEEAFYYKVMEGDSVDKVAMTFGMTKEEIMRANNLQSDAELKPGQRLLIPFLP